MRVKITKTPPPNGMEVQNNQYKTLSSDGVNLVGPSHEQGGLNVSSNGQVVEAEGGEPLYTGSNGENYVFGNMINPASGKKFKNESKALLKDKGKVEKAFDKANTTIEQTDPYGRFDSLKFNAAEVQIDAAKIKQQDLKAKLDTLAKVQDAILNVADSTGADPKKVAKNLHKNSGSVKVRITGAPQAKDGKSFKDLILPPTPEFYPIAQQAPTASPVPATPAPTPTEASSLNTLAARNNNPGNLRFNGQKGATKGDKGFAKFNSYEEGMQALINDLKAKQTGNTKTGLKPTSTLSQLVNVYAPKADNNNPEAYTNFLAKQLGVSVDTPISQLDTTKLAQNIAQFEDSAYASSQGNVASATPPVQTVAPVTPPPTPQGAPNFGPNPQDLNTTAPQAPAGYYNYQNPSYQAIPESQKLPFAGAPLESQINFAGTQPQTSTQNPFTPTPPKPNKLTPLDFLGEIGALFDRPDFVQGQQYDPTLMTPYKISLQDQINQNTASFNALSRNQANNPAALATLAGQNYQQNQQILGQEFRANQAVQNQVASQNNQILNQAEQINNQYADQQFVRQAQAKSNTDRNRQNALNSISNKYAQNNLENQSRQDLYKNAQIYRNLYDNYRFDQNGNQVFVSNGPYSWMYPNQGTVPVTPIEAAQTAQTNKALADKTAKAAFGFKFKK